MKKLLTFLTLLTLSIGVSWAADYVKVTSTSDVTDGTYLIVYETGNVAFNGGLATLDATRNTINVTISNNKIASSSTVDAAAFTITYIQASQKYTIKNTSGKYIGRTSYSNGLDSSTGTVYTNSITIDNGNAVITAEGNCILRYNSASDQKRFRYFKSGQQAIQLYKLEDGGSTEPDPTAPSGSITFTPAAGEVTSGTTVAMSFSGTCTGIKYTTDGTSPSATNGTVYDASNKPTITGATTIKAAAYNYSNSKYAFGTEATASYTVVIPSVEYDGTATFVAGTNMGSTTANNSEDEMTSLPVTVSSDDAAFGRTDNYRLYAGSITEFKVPTGYKIVKIEFTPVNGYSTSLLSTTTGTYSGGTWIGEAESVSFSASAQFRCTQIQVYYTAPASTGPEYYLVGTFNNWTKNEDYKFFENNGTFTLDNVSLPANAQFKIIKVDNGTTWYGGTGEVVYNIHHTHHTGLPMNGNDGSQNYTVQSAGVTSFSFTVNDNTPSNLNVNRAAKLYIKGDFNSWQEEAMVPTANGWTTTKTVATNNKFGFVDEFGQYRGREWTIYDEHIGQAIPMGTNGDYLMGIAGSFIMDVPSDLSTLTLTRLAEGDLYSLITSTDDLEANHEYLVVGKTSTATYVMSKTLDGGRATRISVTPDGNGRISATDAMAIITLDGNSTDGWTLSTSEGYVASGGSGKIQFSSSAVTASIGFGAGDDTEAALIDFSNNTSYPRLKHNTSSQWFACYATTSGTANVYLYKKLTTSNNSAAPVITPESGNIVGFSQEVEITQANGGTIYYTTDGTTPTEDPTHQYNGKFWAEGENLGDEVTITAVAKEEGKELSNPVSVTYKFIAPAAPTFSPQGGTYTSYQYVELASATEGADVYYTTDGSNPSVNNGTKYTEPIAVTENVTIKAITVYHDAHVNKDATSGSRQAKYTIVTDGIVEVENIAEFNAIQPDEDGEYPEVRFKNPVTVLYDYSQRSYSSQLQLTTYQEYIWVKDQSGFTQIFLRPSLNSNNTTTKQIAFYENGDVIPGGFVVRKQYYETGEYYQAYSDKAGTDPTQPGSNVAAGFASATQKALADPEPMTTAQLAALTTSDENIATYNNRYISIGKVKITSNTVSDNKQFRIAGENITISNVVGYHKYSDATSYLKDGKTPVTEVITVPAASNTYYDVTAILCTWQNGWEIMPISFTPWHADEVTLRELCDKGEVEHEYTISNNLLGVYASADGTKLWVKDDDGQAIVKYAPNDEYPDNFAIEADGNTRLDQQYYDQSNWCEILLTNENAGAFVGKIIKGGSIDGTFTNKTNPTMTGVTLTSDDIYSDGSYEPNYYIPCNFYGNQSCQTSQHGQPGHGDFFFMTPKPQEYAMVVWAIWDSENDQFVVNENPQYNSHGFQGSFKVDLSLNQSPNIALHDGMDDNFAYNFSAIIRVNSSKAGSDFMVYPLDLSAATDPATAIESVVAGNGEVKSVKYVNVAGMVSDVPFQGVNIVVTEYTDGSRTTTKMLRK